MIEEFTQSQSSLALHLRHVKDTIVSRGLNYHTNPGGVNSFFLLTDIVRENIIISAFTHNLPILIAALSMPSVVVKVLIYHRCSRRSPAR